KRVRIVRRADGYYCQFCLDTQRKVEHVPTGRQLGVDVGLKAYLTDSQGNTIENPRHYRKAEKKLGRLQRRLSRKHKKSANRKKAQKRLAKQHLKVQRQREDFARKQANALVSSCDLIAYENLQMRNMVRNRKLAKSIHDAGWGIFLQWLARYAFLHDIPVIAVPPHFTSQKCSDCGTIVQKSLSIRTHICHGCGVVLDRDHNAALVRRLGAYQISPTGRWGREQRTSRMPNLPGEETQREKQHGGKADKQEGMYCDAPQVLCVW